MHLTTKLGTAALAAALTLGLAAPAAVASAAPSERRATYKPTLTARATVESDKKLLLSGKVKPAKKGAKVVIQHRLSGSKKWVNVARVKMTKKGTFKYRDSVHKVGKRYYRVVVPAAKGVKRGKSKAVTVTVYHWVDLLKVDPRSYDNTYKSEGQVVGKKYDGVIGAIYGNEGFYDWNLGRSCLTARGLFANGDASDDLAVAHVSLDGDGKPLYSKAFGLTKSERKTVNIKGVFRLAFRWTSTNPAGTPEDQSGAAATFAQPEALCSF